MFLMLGRGFNEDHVSKKEDDGNGDFLFSNETIFNLTRVKFSLCLTVSLQISIRFFFYIEIFMLLVAKIFPALIRQAVSLRGNL